jgi:hypothetical protein
MRSANKKALWLVIFLLLGWPGDCAGMKPEDSIGDFFTGEVLRYEVGFWLIDPVGGGVADFRSLGHGRYMVYHVGKAEGLVAWLTSYRREIYRSTMGSINNGKRLIPLRFEEYSVIGEWFLKKTTIYDYQAHKVFTEQEKVGEPKRREEIEIPLGALYDPVTAFYNLRFGVYGKVEPGMEFILRTLPSKQPEIIRIKVASKEETERKRAAEKIKTGKDLLIQILIDREMWGRKKGELEVWFNRDLIPISGVVKDIPFFGNVRGRLSFQGYSPVPLPEDLPNPVGKKNVEAAKWEGILNAENFHPFGIWRPQFLINDLGRNRERPGALTPAQ